ncbi:MAG: dependent oxidoreductase [Chloroflexi bacterium]|nr:dependent oxidoreductase [Chloroflexota bacterium]
MRERADVVIIGGGVIGASIAFHLAQRGLTDVVIVERSALGAGSTGRSAGGVRQQFSTETNCRMSMLSVQKLRSFESDTGWDPGFQQVGYLFLLTTPQDWELFQRNVALQRGLGLEVDLTAAQAAKAMVPPLMVDDVLGAAFCSTDGHADPTNVCLGYAAVARELGVEVCSGVSVTGISLEAGAVTAVETSEGSIRTPCAVIAAGPWSGEVARCAGIEVPIQPYRRQLYYIERADSIRSTAPMVVDFASSMYFRPEGPGLLLGMTDRSEPSSFSTNTDDRFLAMLIDQAVRRVPVLEGVGFIRGWAGLYDVTPDANPILGPIPDVQGLIMASGFSGHGFMHAPATGQLIAEILVDGNARSIDVSAFSSERFRGEGITPERNVI